MKVYSPERIRNVALVGHGGVGKTTLCEALLYRAGVVNRPGSVEEGTTLSDFEPEERDRGFSLSLALTPFEWKGHKVNLIDTPGYADFISDVHAAMRVADLAIFVVSAVEGVETQTEQAWQIAADQGVPRMIFINKLDKERASFDRTLAEIKERFGSGVAPIELPIGEEDDFRGVVDLFREKAYVYTSGSAEETPMDMGEREDRVHDDLVEGIVVADDTLLEQYLEGEVPPVEKLEETMAIGIAEATVFPVVCGSATGPIAVDRLADFIVELGPSPLQRPPVTAKVGDETVEIEPRAAGEPLALVFKTIADPYVGQISLMRVLSGTLEPETTLTNPRTASDERLAKLAVVLGKETELIPSAPTGDIVATSKLSDTRTGDTLAPKNMPVTLEPVRPSDPVLSMAIVARSQGDEDKLGAALHRLIEEDPSLVMERNEETSQTLLKGMGEMHLIITRERLSRKFGVEIDTEEVRVPYRETITRPVDAEGKYKKQSGGHGQFGVANLRIEPGPRGSGFEFVDDTKGGVIPRQFISAVEKGVVEAMLEDGRWGYPVVDVIVHVIHGKAHSVDSSEMAFKMAGRLGFREAYESAGPMLLEPMSEIEVTVPSDYQGEVLGDLASRRGQVQGTSGDGDSQHIEALVPTSEIMNYAIDLRSLSHGWGTFSARHSHYQDLPPNLAERIPASGTV
ncbi:MAG: elongation factor G [Acidimicrobiia bacterium]|nr:elongation factor G [Acidimicrobiia bacterium]